MKLMKFLNENLDWNTRFSHIKSFFEQATDLKHLSQLKKEAIKKVDSKDPTWKDGPVEFFSKQKREELKQKLGIGVKIASSKEARMERILRIKDSSGKSTARKFK